MPVVYVKDTKGTIIHIEEAFSSLIWTERYQDDGEFEMDLPLKIANKDAYKKDNYVIMDDSDVTMLIETIETTDSDSTLKISGRSLSCLLERRVNASKALELHEHPICYEGDFEDVVSAIVRDDITHSYAEDYEWRHYNADGEIVGGYGDRAFIVKVKYDTPGRDISNFSYVNTVSNVAVSKKYEDLKSIHDIIVSFSKTYVTGFRIDLDNYGNFIFKTYKGTDRTGITKSESPVIFGPSMDNVIYVNSFDDDTNYKNCVLVVQDYEEPDEDKELQPGDNDPCVGFYFRDVPVYGIDRREFIVDADKPQKDSETGEMEGTNEEFRQAAAEEAFESDDYDRIKTTEGAVDPLVQYKLGSDYFLGDIVRIESWTGEYSISLIDEIVRSYDSEGYVVTPNFKSMDDYDYGEES